VFDAPTSDERSERPRRSTTSPARSRRSSSSSARSARRTHRDGRCEDKKFDAIVKLPTAHSSIRAIRATEAIHDEPGAFAAIVKLVGA